MCAGETYIDPGANATDGTGKNITSSIERFGAAAVDTKRPTAPGEPFLVTYRVADALGRRAAEAIRQVIVACPGVSTQQS